MRYVLLGLLLCVACDDDEVGREIPSCASALLNAASATLSDFYSGLPNACDEVSDCTQVSVTKTRDDKICIGGAPLAVSVVDAFELELFIATDQKLAGQCEAIYSKDCFVSGLSGPASAIDCVDHECTRTMGPLSTCDANIVQPLQTRLTESYTALSSTCAFDSDCTHSDPDVERHGNPCYDGCPVASAKANEHAVADFLENDAALTEGCDAILNARCRSVQSCVFGRPVCEAGKCVDR